MWEKTSKLNAIPRNAMENKVAKTTINRANGTKEITLDTLI